MSECEKREFVCKHFFGWKPGTENWKFYFWEGSSGGPLNLAVGKAMESIYIFCYKIKGINKTQQCQQK